MLLRFKLAILTLDAALRESELLLDVFEVVQHNLNPVMVLLRLENSRLEGSLEFLRAETRKMS